MSQQYSLEGTESNVILIACMFGITILVLIGVFVRIVRRHQRNIHRLEALGDLHEATKKYTSLVRDRSVDPSEWEPAKEKLFAHYAATTEEAERRRDKVLVLKIKDNMLQLIAILPLVEQYEIMARKL